MDKQTSVSEQDDDLSCHRQSRLHMSWKMAFLYVQENGMSKVPEISLCEGLELSGKALGFEVNVCDAEEKPFVMLTREGLEMHMFTDGRMHEAAYEFLLGCLAFNAAYYPDEESTWRPEELNALSFGLKQLRLFQTQNLLFYLFTRL